MSAEVLSVVPSEEFDQADHLLFPEGNAGTGLGMAIVFSAG